MEPKQFLNLAHELCSKRNDEAALRTSVSRSYYALHNFLRQFIREQKLFVPSKGAEVHELIIQDLMNCGVKEVISIAKDVDNLREDRNDADYEMELTTFTNPNHANLLYARAKMAWDGFQSNTNSKKKRQQITKGIMAFRKKIQRQVWSA